MIASADDEVFIGVGSRHPDEECLVGLLIDHGVVLRQTAHDVPPHLMRMPGFVQSSDV